MAQYEGLASIYDGMIEIDYDKWMSFIEEYFKNKNIDISGRNALELGCGTGNMTVRLLNSGMNLTAIDISDDMLALCDEKTRKEKQKVFLLNQDMVDFSINKKFDFAFSFCDGYNYISDDKNAEKSFSNVYNHLACGGYFVFDMSTDHKFLSIVKDDSYSYVGDDVCYIWDNYYENDILDMYITFFIKNGEFYKRCEERHVLRAYNMAYIEKLLKKAGFSSIEKYDDYKFCKAAETSDRITYICKREE